MDQEQQMRWAGMGLIIGAFLEVVGYFVHPANFEIEGYSKTTA